jgi:methyl-accepting chemotaxis protein
MTGVTEEIACQINLFAINATVEAGLTGVHSPALKVPTNRIFHNGR